MAVNLVRCARYGDRYLMSPKHLEFDVISDTKEKTRKSRELCRKGQKRSAETDGEHENDLTEVLGELQSVLQEEKKRTSELSNELNTANLTLEYYQLKEVENERQLERLTKTNEGIVRDYDALKAATDEKVRELESRIVSLTTQLEKKRKLKKRKRAKTLPEHVSDPFESGLSWVQELGASVIAV